jgi:23S rRNA (cytidine2498-2'-O)-methyltransferase
VDGSTSQFVFTAAPEAALVAFREIQRVDPKARLLDWLAPGIGRAATDLEWDRLAATLRRRPPLFVRHVCPVQVTVRLAGSRQDLDLLSDAAATLKPSLNPSLSFSVQTRILADQTVYGRFNVNERLAAVLSADGAAIDVRQPAQVLSVVCTLDQGYLGLSQTADNLSDWAGGERRFKREQGQVSRSEFKLLEAMELFGLEFPSGGQGLDLGAAPGGWTRVMRRHAMRVVAVDPAQLHPILASDPVVEHVRQLAHSFLTNPRYADLRFDVILSDARMDARDSARLMVMAADRLRRDGWALVTLKLPQRDMAEIAIRAIRILRPRYFVVGARQLFHDRSEITVALTLRGAAPNRTGP